MSEKLYKIKPLVWEKDSRGNYSADVNISGFVEVYGYYTIEATYHDKKNAGYKYELNFCIQESEYVRGEISERFLTNWKDYGCCFIDSIEQGMDIANKDWYIKINELINQLFDQFVES